MLRQNSGNKFTFWLTALDSENRLRYPSVSLGFDMRGRSWLSPGVWENLFDIEFATPRSSGECQVLQNLLAHDQSEGVWA